MTYWKHLGTRPNNPSVNPDHVRQLARDETYIIIFIKKLSTVTVLGAGHRHAEMHAV